MKELIEKLTSYNLFNYLVPGAVFSVLADRFTHYTFIQENLFVAFFVYYFAGMVVSRVGSLILEPFLRWTGFVKFAPYKDFVRASAQDKKLDLLSEANNSFRTLAAVSLALALVKAVEVIIAKLQAPDWLAGVGLALFLFALFLFSYRKQTAYIKKRIESNLERQKQ